MELLLRARRVHIAGSAGRAAPRAELDKVHRLIRRATRLFLEDGATFVSSIGAEPRCDEGTPLVFYWTCLEEVAARVREHPEEARTRTPLVKIVATEKALASIPDGRDALWRELLASGAVAVEALPPGWRSASLARIRQAQYGNLLIAVSGAVGTHHLAELYGERGNPVIPLPFDLGSSRDERATGAFELSRQARTDATRFFALAAGDPTATLLTLDARLDGHALADRLRDLVRALKPPQAFCMRLMNPTVEEFEPVEYFFQHVVGPVLRELGYEPFDLSVDRPSSMFVNLEIFAKLHRSALAVCELTGLRQNVFMEGGYALGRGIPTILAVRHGRELPFDADELATHKWSPDEDPDAARVRFRADARAALVRRPLIG